MTTVADFFLSARHWQIFTMTWGVYFVGGVVLEALAPSGALSLANWRFLIIFEALMLLFAVCFLGWLWSIGVFLHHIVKPTLRMNLAFFQAAVVYATLYVLVAVLLFLSAPDWVIIPLHFVALFSLIYAFYYVARTLSLANKKREVMFGDYAVFLFLVWFSPVGVWKLQPRINQLHAERKRN